MKLLAAGLLALLLLLQYRLWLGEGGTREVARLREEISAQRAENEQLKVRNRTLAAEVQDLKKGTTAIEERARTDLGMVGKGETFYQVVPQGFPSVIVPRKTSTPDKRDDNGDTTGATQERVAQGPATGETR
jgi:cell division protein FtsB